LPLHVYFSILAGLEYAFYISLSLVLWLQATVKVVTVYRDNDEVNYARPGENLRIRLSGVEEEDISPGFVISSVSEYSDSLPYQVFGCIVKSIF